MLRNLVFACALAVAISLPVTIEPTVAETAARTFEFDDGASFDPMAALDGRQLEEEIDGRQLAETTTASTATKKPSGASGPQMAGLSSLRYKLSQSYCPSAGEAEKVLLACKNLAISQKVRQAKDETEKRRLVDERKALYTAATKKPEAEKKKAAEDHKAMYSKAFGKYCASKATSDVCTNELMSKMYGGAKTMGVKKAKKKKA